MKKLLLTLGSVASIAAPVAAVVACGTEVQEDTTITREISSTKTQKELREVKVEDVDGKKLGVVLTTLGLRTDSNIVYEEEFSWIPERLELTGYHMFGSRKATTIYTIIPVLDA